MTSVAPERSPIKYWRRDEPVKNFGDYIAEFLEEELFFPVSGDNGPIYVVGSSIADFMVSDILDDRPGPADEVVTFWGCGVRDELGLSEANAARSRILAVRGPLSASVLKVGALVPQGDPGLLLPALYQPRHSEITSGRTVCMPHFWDGRSDAELRAISGCDFVLRTTIAGRYDFMRLIDAIASAEFVLSASLHGAIVAAAYKTPFGFWDPGKIDLPLKWRDFAELISIQPQFHAEIGESREHYSRFIAPNVRMPSVWPLLVSSPLPLRPSALLNILHYELANTPTNDLLGEIEAKAASFQRHADHTDAIFQSIGARITEVEGRNTELQYGQERLEDELRKARWAGQQDRTEHDRLEAEASRLADERRQMQAERDVARHLLEDAQTAQAQLATEAAGAHAKASRQLGDTREALQRAQSRADASEQALRQLRAELENSRARLDAGVHAAEALQSALAQSEARAEEAAARALEAHRSERIQVRAEVEAAGRAADALRSEVAETRTRLDAADRASQALRSELAQTEARAESSFEAQRVQQAQLLQAEAAIAATDRDRSRLERELTAAREGLDLARTAIEDHTTRHRESITQLSLERDAAVGERERMLGDVESAQQRLDDLGDALQQSQARHEALQRAGETHAAEVERAWSVADAATRRTAVLQVELQHVWAAADLALKAKEAQEAVPEPAPELGPEPPSSPAPPDASGSIAAARDSPVPDASETGAAEEQTAGQPEPSVPAGAPARAPRRRWDALSILRARRVTPERRARIETLRTTMRGLVLPRAKQPTASIIIPNYGDPEMALRCLRSIAWAPSLASTETLLWEDASGDPDVSLLAKVQGLRYGANKLNQGFIRTCNAAAKVAGGEYLVFLNSDTIVTPGWLDALVDVAAARPDAGVVGSKLLFPDGRLQEAGGIAWSDGSAWNFGRDDRPDRPLYNYLREVDYVSGAALLVSRELFARLGGFDTAYAPAYCEDSDLAFRVREAGKKVYYQPRSVVEHHEGASNGTDLTSGVKAYQVENSRKLLARWRDVLERESFPNAEHVFLAKDRGRTRRTVLVIDHYVPKPDRDAGSKTMMQFLQCLVESGWLVKFWPENLHFDEVYTPPLLDMGIEVFCGPEYAPFERWIAEHGRYFDVILTSRPHITAPMLDAIEAHSQAGLAYYGHDVHHLRMIANAEVAQDAVDADQIAAVQAQEEAIWRRTDVVLYPSASETDYVRERVPSTEARTITPYCYDSFERNAAATLKARDGLLFVAGFGHPPNEDAALWLVQEIMPQVWATAPELKLSLVGSYPTPAVQALACDRVEVTGWVDEETLQRHYQDARVAAVPLRYGAGVKSKVVEAMRAGLPLVTTSTGVQGLSGAEASVEVHDLAEPFADAIRALLTDDALWRSRSWGAADFVAEHFGRQTMRRQLDDALTTAAAKGRRAVV